MSIILLNAMKNLARKSSLLLAVLYLGWLAGAFSDQAQANPSTLKTRPSPDWLASSVVYEIFPRNFSQAGDLNAITARLDELNDLGFNILWLMPIHPTGEKLQKGSLGSPFAVRDFYAINPAYGDGYCGGTNFVGQRADGASGVLPEGYQWKHYSA